jgi:hypothetical protein
MEVSGQLYVPATLPPGKSPLDPSDRRLGRSQSCSGCGGEEKNSQLPPGIEPYNLIVQPVACLYRTRVITSTWASFPLL